MAGIGEAASILALVTFAFDTSKKLYKVVSSFKSRRTDVQEVQNSLTALVTVLDLVQQRVLESGDERKYEPLRQPMRCCTSTCEDMQKTLDACTQRTNDVHACIRDWLQMQFHGKNFAEMRQRLASYQSTLSIAFASVNIQDYSTTQESIEEMKDLIEGTKQDLIDQAEKVEEAIRDAAESLRDRLRADRAQIQRALDTLAQAQQVANTTRPEIVIEKNQAGDDSRAIFGTDVLRPQFGLRVANNTAGERATVGAGIHSPETLQVLLSVKPEVANLMQTLQRQPQRSDKRVPQDTKSMMMSPQQISMMGERRSIEHNPPQINVSEQDVSTQSTYTPKIISKFGI